MRKFLVAGIGVFLLSGAVVLTSDAGSQSCSCFVNDSVDPKSRYKSKGCCKDLKRATRPFSNRIGPWRYRKSKTTCKNCKVYKTQHASRREDVYLHSQYRTSNLTRQQKLAYQRQIFGEDNGGRTLNTQVSDRIVVRNNDFAYQSGRQVENKVAYKSPKNFTVSFPNSFTLNDGVYRSRNSSLAFRITSGGKCNPIAFTDCSRRLENKLNKENNFYNVSGEQTFYRWNQTVLSSFDYHQTVVKTFNATSRGKHNSYFTFTTLDPNSGEILRIEAVSNSSGRNQAAQQINNIFESFRFKI